VIPKDCKRLAEVDFPIAVVSKHAAREKSIRHGHPSTLHLWWARRPLASSRAVLLALLLPDPCDVLCPPEFSGEARKLLPQVDGCNPGSTDEDLRKALLKFIGNFANWDMAANRTYLEVSRALVKAAHGEDPPLVVDPFAGGGSIPLEALRLGCDTFASDLNPVACLILKVMLEDIPRQGPELGQEVRLVGAKIKQQAEVELSDLYPEDPDGATPIAYLWARTVRCESPNCGAEIPLMRSFWLCKKARRKRALRFRVLRPAEGPPHAEFEVFEPDSEREVPSGTVARAKASCVACGTVLPPARVRTQLAAQRGGADAVFDEAGRRTGGARIMAVITLREGERGRHYRVPVDADYRSVWHAQKRLSAALDDWEARGSQGRYPIPDEPLKRVPVTFGVINVWVYGMDVWSDLFSARQKLALMSLARLVSEQPSPRVHALALDRLADYSSSLCRWVPNGEFIGNTFGRQALPMIWDFCEVNPFSSATGGYPGALEWVANVMSASPISRVGQVESASATSSPLPDSSCAVWFTDPPYYDSVPYSYISDFFFVWLKRILGPSDPAVFGQTLSPKDEEIVAYLTEGGDAKDAYRRYEERMAIAFAAGRRVLDDVGIGCVVFAHKTTEGWEALLSGLIQGGWTITGSWPVATEMGERLRARDSATLSTSVHLVCRPRPDDAGIGDWANVLRELPSRVGAWMERLQGEGVRGADLVFACIGPALEIFSRYSRVESADGRKIELAEYLEKVWEVVGRSALAQVLGTADAMARNGASGAVEEDARLTALFLWTLQSTTGDVTGSVNGSRDEEEQRQEPDDEDADEEEGSSRGKVKGFTLVFDVVRRFAQPLGIALPQWEGRVIETKKGVVRLLPIAERAKQLFGEEGAHAVAERLERDTPDGTEPLQGVLFPLADNEPRVRERSRAHRPRAGFEVSDEGLAGQRNATTLERVHVAMLLQAGGRANALRALLKDEQMRGPEFLRLANALSALYPKASEEKRLLDAMLLAVPR
jgi:adenine-specific DNA methylase